MTRLVSVQLLRFIAAAAVVVSHAWPKAHPGAAGVDLFFVISGFVITGAARTTPNAGVFLRDRATRIYPIYWLCFGVLLAMMAATTTLDWRRVVTGLTLWPLVDGYQGHYLIQAWSLSFEILFYLGAAVVVWRPRLLPALLATYLGALAWHFVAPDDPAGDYFGSPLVLEFLAGVVIALVPRRFGLASLLIGSVTLIGGALWANARLDPVGPIVDPWRVLYVGLPAALVVYGAVQMEGRLPKWKALSFPGDASYSIYLIHRLVLILVSGPVGFAASIVVGFGLYRYVEKPMLKWLRRERNPIRSPHISVATTTD